MLYTLFIQEKSQDDMRRQVHMVAHNSASTGLPQRLLLRMHALAASPTNPITHPPLRGGHPDADIKQCCLAGGHQAM
jgi:hypothetical protein